MIDTVLSPSRARVADLVEQVGAIGLFAWLVVRIWPDHLSAANWYPLLLLVSEGVVVLLLLMRQRTENISLKMSDWAIALGGTFLALMVFKGDGAPLAGALGPLMMVTGLLVQVGAKLSLWRSFGIIPAHRGVRVTGLYRFVRHPMYLGYMIAHAGYLLYAPSWWNLAVYACVWSLLVARIFAEERVLGTDPEYRAFQQRVRTRLVPGVF